MRILVVEDEPRLRAVLTEAIARAGHAVEAAADGGEALELLSATACDAVVLDVVLPRASGLEVCRAARRRGLTVPILLLTARDTTADKVEGLDAGADDYVVKPFALDELLARLRALLRRQAARKDGVLQVGDVTFDPATGAVARGGRPIELPRKERALLEFLMRRAGRIVTREQILEHVWEPGADPESDVVRAHIKLLRKALADGEHPRLIRTVHGIGYRMAADA